MGEEEEEDPTYKPEAASSSGAREPDVDSEDYSPPGDIPYEHRPKGARERGKKRAPSKRRGDSNPKPKRGRGR